MIPLETWLLFCVACARAGRDARAQHAVPRLPDAGAGPSAGFVSLAGTSTGFALHALAAAFGLSALLAAVPLAFEVVKWAGAIYLAWLAMVMWRTSDEPEASVAAPHSTPRAMYRQGLLTAVLNPKVARVPARAVPAVRRSGARQRAGAEPRARRRRSSSSSSRAIRCCVFAATGARRWFARRPGWGRWSKRALAGVFAALAARLALQSRT